MFLSLVAKMASAPVPLVSVGECVRHDSRTWLVTAIRNVVGWNQYHLVDLDTGLSVVRARFQLETIPFIDVVTDGEFDGTMEAKVEPQVTRTSSVDEGAGPSSRQWNERSKSELTRLQENRHSKSTAHQTKWQPRSFEVRPPFWPKRSHCLANCPLDIFL